MTRTMKSIQRVNFEDCDPFSHLNNANYIRYLKPSLLGEELEIWTRMLSFDRFRNLVEFVMLCPQKRQLKAVMHSEFAYIAIKQAKPVAVDEQTLGLFEQISLFPGIDISSIEINDRIKQIKAEILGY